MMSEQNQIITIDNIQNLIFTIRGAQVMFDNDLAELYQVETKNLNRAVNRNIERFPEKFRFQLTQIEFDEYEKSLRFQFGTLKNGRGQHSKYLPHVYTEQGVSMLSAVLRSETAIKVSIQIIDAFVEMRKFISQNAAIFQRLDKVEMKQLETDQQFEKIFKALEDKSIKTKQGIFYDGQIFDAYVFVSDIIKSANKSILLIDNYVDESVLTLLAKRNKNVRATIYTKTISKQLMLDLTKHNNQYPEIKVLEFKNAHDRFLILDEKELYHFGASLKDLGKKWFAFSKMDSLVPEVITKLKNEGENE